MDPEQTFLQMHARLSGCCSSCSRRGSASCSSTSTSPAPSRSSACSSSCTPTSCSRCS
ncbi:hypothetical protein ACP70R_033240 [Stipagrostis hirtigluma subsp. patula]